MLLMKPSIYYQLPVLVNPFETEWIHNLMNATKSLIGNLA